MGLPPIMQSVVMNCKNKDDVDLLVGDIYQIALGMKTDRQARVRGKACSFKFNLQ